MEVEYGKMKIKRVIASILSATLIFSNVGVVNATNFTTNKTSLFEDKIDTQVIEVPMEMEEDIIVSDDSSVTEDAIMEEEILSDTEILESNITFNDNENDVKESVSETESIDLVDENTNYAFDSLLYIDDNISLEEETEINNSTENVYGTYYDMEIEPNLNIQTVERINYSLRAVANTVIDVTGLASGAESSHDCSKYLESKYDTNQHWQQCSVCGKVYGSKTNHSYTDGGWTMGNTSCHINNKLLKNCSCGYSYYENNTRSHASGFWYNNISGHSWACSRCRQVLSNSGKHKNSAGQVLGCVTGISGTCATCGDSVGIGHSGDFSWNYPTGFGDYRSCFNNCGFDGIDFNNSTFNVKYSGTSFIIDTTIHTKTGSVGGGKTAPQLSGPIVIDKSSYSISGWSITYHIEGHFNTGYNTGTYSIIAPISMSGCFYGFYINLRPEIIAPTINNPILTDISTSNGWATQKQITISGTENYCNSVKIDMKDSSGNSIYKGNASVSNKNYSVSFIPNIEADANGKTYTVTVTDTLGNSSTKSFTVYKTDKKSPIPTSGTATSTTWSKSKDMNFSATDGGVGGVQIAFNNTNAYSTTNQSGTSFSRPYTFVGDVYGSVKAAVYFKDALGNTTTQFVTISNIDNTAPTITDAVSTANSGSATVTVTANDINTTLNASGSGVKEYAITASNAAPTTGWQSSNTLTVTSPGTYYVWARDAVGNVSASKQVKVTINYNLIVKPNGGTWNSNTTDQTFTLVNGGTKTIANPTRIGYTFIGWTVSGTDSSLNGTTFTMGIANASLTANWRVTSYTISYNLDGGSATNPTSYNVETATFTLKNPSKVGYTFNGWTGSNGSTPQTSVSIAKGSTGNKSYTANWKANTDTKYVVNHYQQNIADDNYTLKETENLAGTTGANVTPNTKTYTGFTSPAKQTVTIKADGSTVVNYYYTRNKYTVTLNKGPGIASISGNGTYKYGASVSINATLNAGYQWSKWSGTHNTTTQKYTFTMPANNVTDTANASLITYSISYNLDGGSATNPISYNVETATFTLKNPTKVGYTFTGWTGSNGTTAQTSVSITTGSTGDKSYTANWKINQYLVTYIDVVGSTGGKELGRSTVNLPYGSAVRGADKGSDKTDNKYYNQYAYVSDTNATVSTSGATVYRIFKYLTVDKTSNVTWNDNNNADGFRPNEYTLKLKQNGKVIKEVKLPSSQSNNTFSGLDKYDSNGKAYNYTFDIDATDRYKISVDENGNIIVNDYQKASFSVSIPKKISLNGMLGQGTYDVKVKGTFFYNDTLMVTPTASFALRDKANIKTMQATVAQSKTSFKLVDGVNSGTSTKGTIKLDRSQFAGSWNGTFNFNIKFTMSN